VPTPVGPAPRDPFDPDLWDWGDPADAGYRSNGGHDDRDLVAALQRRRRQRRLLALAVVVVLVVAILATTL
jgi:hypothetical protein